MSRKTLMVTAISTFLWSTFVFIWGTALGWSVGVQRTEAKVPSCQEDEYIYPEDFPDGKLICVHQDLIIEGNQ